MERHSYESHPHPLLSQTQQNTTLWVGHLQTDPTDHFAGQTFTCPAGGQLDNIQVYTAAVNQPGELGLSLHEFDPVSRTWGPALAEAHRPIEFGDEARWTRFGLQPVELKREATYGFRLSTPDAMVGIGEAATGQNNPFTNGLEWHADSENQEGQYYSYFSLAFKVECA
jgi:hypothetical protein